VCDQNIEEVIVIHGASVTVTQQNRTSMSGSDSTVTLTLWRSSPVSPRLTK
jgi:hypothetical protein